MNKREIQTFVIFDTESTGLPSPGNNPKITELCLLALSRGELQSRHKEPRVFNNLHLCLDPVKQIHHRSSEITGLYNDALSCQATFKRQAGLVVSFLQTLKHPVCIIAHNGHGFDFPLLKAELKRSNENLSDEILCADSLHAFRTFDGIPSVPDFVIQRDKLSQRSQTVKSEINSQAPSSGNVTAPNQDLISDANQGTMMNLSGLKRSVDCLGPGELYEEVVIKKGSHDESLQSINEQTPDRKPDPLLRLGNEKKGSESCQNVEGDTLKSVRKNLFISQNNEALKSNDVSIVSEKESNKAETESSNKNSGNIDTKRDCENPFGHCIDNGSNRSPIIEKRNTPMSNSVKKSYALGNLYSFYFGQKPEIAHTAADDCKTLLKLIILKLDKFISYCDDNAVSFSEIEPMY